MRRLILSALLPMALAACDLPWQSSNPSGPQVSDTTSMTLSGAVSAQFRESAGSHCSIAPTGGSDSKTILTFNAARSSSSPTFVLLFNVFPYTGPGTYTNIGAHAGSEVVMVSTAGGIGSAANFKGKAGQIVVDAQSDSGVSGTIAVDVTVPTPPFGTAHLAGKWSCTFAKQSPKP